MSYFERSELVLGEKSTEKLKNSKVIVFGVGGVGSYTVEALTRAGVGTIAIVDNDTVSQSNINRQLIATTKTIGSPKTDVCRSRINEINPDIKVITYQKFASYDNLSDFNLEMYDYIVDAIDCVSTKIALAEFSSKSGVPLISSMGTGNKIDATRFKVADIFKTSVCPLARVMRYELKKRNVKKLKVVFSDEEPKKNKSSNVRVPGSVPFVPGVAGLIIAGEVIKHLAEKE